MKERLTAWGLDEQMKQKALAQDYHVAQCSIQDMFHPFPIDDACPDNKPGVDPLMEMDLLPVAHELAPSAMFFKVSKPNGTHPQFVHLTNLGEVAAERGEGMITLSRDVFCTCGFNVMLHLGCRHYWAVVKDSCYAGFHLGLIHAQYFLEDPPAHEDYLLMQRPVPVSLTPANIHPAPVIQQHEVPKWIVPGGGGGGASTLMREAKLQKLWYQVQLKALWREFDDIAVSSTELFQLQTWIEGQKRPLRPEVKAANPPKPPTKSSKRNASKEAMGGRKKKRNTPAPVPSPDNVVVALPYTHVPLSPLVPLTPIAPVDEDPDVVVTRSVPPAPSVSNGSMLPAAPPYAYSQASQPYPLHSTPLMALPYPVSQATSSSQLPTQGTSLSYPLTLSNPLTQGSQAPKPSILPNYGCGIFSNYSTAQPRVRTIPTTQKGARQRQRQRQTQRWQCIIVRDVVQRQGARSLGLSCPWHVVHWGDAWG